MNQFLDFTSELGPAFLPIVFIAIVGFISYYLNKKYLEKLRTIAPALGLQFAEKESIQQPSFGQDFTNRLVDLWEMSGNYHSVKVRIFGRSQGYGKNKRTFTYVVAYLNEPIKEKMAITKDDDITKLISKFLPLELKLGNEHLDEKYYIHGTSKEKILEFLTRSGVEAVVDEVLAYSDNTSIREDGIWYQGTVGETKEESKLREILDFIVPQTRKLSDLTGSRDRSSDF